MLARVLEPEVMDTPDDARDYDAMDHTAANATFAAAFLARWDGAGVVHDVGTGTGHQATSDRHWTFAAVRHAG